ncbi:MAG: GDSL-type esterase/lipase family protein [Paracoccaceae bacterium]|nr:hypothetical protein [Maritimibacter sp.]
MRQHSKIMSLVAANILLLALVAVIATREDYWSKAIRKLSGDLSPVTDNRRYRSQSAFQKHLIAQVAAGADVRIAFTGDSTVEGWLTSAAVPRSINLGISGDTMLGLLARTDAETVALIPTWYVAIGVNDALRGLDPGDIPDYVAQLADLFGRAEQLYWRAVLPVTREDWSAEHEAVRVALNDRINATCAAMANCTFLPPPQHDPGVDGTWTNDGLHPNADGYCALTRQACRYLRCVSDTT